MKSKIILLSIFAIILLFLATVIISFYCGWFGHHFILIKTNFTQLLDWEKDDHKQALETLQKSCLVIAKQNPEKSFSHTISQSGKFADWQKICLAIDQIDKNDTASARKFFEYWFVPYRVYDNFKNQGLFTGYYLPTLNCSLTQDQQYTVPIYAIPDDWVKVDLGIFDAKLKGRTIVGQVKNNRLNRYPDRAAIVKGAITKTAKVLAWCDDKVDVAFAHIQGSAIIQLHTNIAGFQGFALLDPNIFGTWLSINKQETDVVQFPCPTIAYHLAKNTENPNTMDLLDQNNF